MKATKEQNWKAQVNRNEVKEYIKVLTRNLDRLDLEDAEDTAAMHRMLKKVSALNAELVEYMYKVKVTNKL